MCYQTSFLTEDELDDLSRAPEHLEIIALWLDDPDDPETEVQDDLRRWAGMIPKLVEELKGYRN